MARPKKHKVGLTRVVPFRLSEIEYLAFQEKVTSAGMTQSEFIRDCVLKNKTTIVNKTKSSLEKKRMQFIFNKAGNNINQIAHSMNAARMTGKVSDTFLQNALLCLGDISKFLKSALNHVD